MRPILTWNAKTLEASRALGEYVLVCQGSLHSKVSFDEELVIRKILPSTVLPVFDVVRLIYSVAFNRDKQADS